MRLNNYLYNGDQFRVPDMYKTSVWRARDLKKEKKECCSSFVEC